MRRTSLALVAATLLPCLAQAAFADLVKATSVADTAITGAYATSGASTDVASINGVFFDFTATATGTRAFTVNYSPQTPAGETTLFLFLGAATSSVTVTDIRFHNGAFDPGTLAGANAQGTGFGGPFALSTGTNRIVSTGFTNLNGFTNVGGYTHVSFYVNFTAIGSRLQLDYIANPEPGTMALMGLGLAGLGGIVWRRRRAAKAAKPTA